MNSNRLRMNANKTQLLWLGTKQVEIFNILALFCFPSAFLTFRSNGSFSSVTLLRIFGVSRHLIYICRNVCRFYGRHWSSSRAGTYAGGPIAAFGMSSFLIIAQLSRCSSSSRQSLQPAARQPASQTHDPRSHAVRTVRGGTGSE